MERWIPISEKMPEMYKNGEAREVLITVVSHDDDCDYKDVYKGYYEDGSWWTQWVHGCKRIEDNFDGQYLEVTAWMPVPAPYDSDGAQA